jgi:hypothetical protein
MLNLIAIFYFYAHLIYLWSFVVIYDTLLHIFYGHLVHSFTILVCFAMRNLACLVRRNKSTVLLLETVNRPAMLKIFFMFIAKLDGQVGNHSACVIAFSCLFRLHKLPVPFVLVHATRTEAKCLFTRTVIFVLYLPWCEVFYQC